VRNFDDVGLLIEVLWQRIDTRHILVYEYGIR
jgi:hypothetical protein